MDQIIVETNPAHAPSLVGCSYDSTNWGLTSNEISESERTLVRGFGKSFLKGFGVPFISALFALGMYYSYGNPGVIITAGFGVAGLAVKGFLVLANRKKTSECNCG